MTRMLPPHSGAKLCRDRARELPQVRQGLVWLAALTLLLLCGCGIEPSRPPSAPTPTRVVARVGGELGLEPDPPLAARELVLARSTRVALVVAPQSSFALRPDHSASRLAFSLGWTAAADVDSVIQFRVEAKVGDAWDVLFEERVPADASGWRDRRIDLVGPVRHARHFRFSTSLPLPGSSAIDQNDGPRPCWGSIVFLGTPEAQAGQSAAERPNILLLSLDTLGAEYLASFGGPSGVSPAIDAFMAEALSFRRAFAPYGSTLPSHSSLFSALYPLHHRRYSAASAPLASLVTGLADAGYMTVAFTENAYVGSAFGFARGFDRYHDGSADAGYEAIAGQVGETFGRATDWLEKWGGETRFFMFLHTYEVHSPYLPRDERARAFANRIEEGSAPHPSPRDMVERIRRHNQGSQRLTARSIRALKALHLGEIQYLDRMVGELMQRLETLGLAQNTLVVMLSDHGDQFGELGMLGHGYSMHNRVLHVPLGFRWRDRIEPRKLSAPVELVDVFPTLLDLLGLAVPEGLDGRSLASLLRGETDQLEARPAFAEARLFCGAENASDCWSINYSVQNERYKVVANRSGQLVGAIDLQANPAEDRERDQVPRDVRRSLMQALRSILESEVPPPEAPERELEPDAVTEAQLRALGYTEQ